VLSPVDLGEEKCAVLVYDLTSDESVISLSLKNFLLYHLVLYSINNFRTI
jgi:hypothetical protein